MNTRTAANLALSAGVTALVIVLAEGWARRTEASRPAAPLADTRGLDWEAEWQGDFFVVKSSAVGWPPGEEFNREGLRDRRHPREKLPGTYRVACLGDSVTAGYGFPRERSWPAALERAAAARGRGVEVLNVSLMGWSTLQERYAYERIARAYHPDAAVLGICLNDVEDLQNNLSRPPRLLSALYRRSAFVRWVIDPRGREIRSVEELFETPEPARVGRGYARLFEEIRKLRADVEDDGGRLALVIFPDADQVGPDPRPALPQARLAAFARAEGLAVVDALPALRAAGPAAFLDRLHLTPAGSQAVAAAALEAGVVPSSAWRAAAPARSVPELAAALRADRAGDRADAARGLEAAGPLPEDVRNELFVALADPSETVRWAAADALAAQDLSEPDDAARLGALLASPDTYVRGFAAWSLGQAGPAAVRAERELVAREADPDPGVRTLVVRALGNLGAADPGVVAALERSLDAGSDEERFRAARALVKLGPGASPAVASLSRALDASDPRLRREAARSLARIGAPSEAALPRLIAARRDPDPAVREAAEKAIRRITASH